MLVVLVACTSPAPEPDRASGDGVKKGSAITLGTVSTGEAMKRLCRRPVVKGGPAPGGGPTLAAVVEVGSEVQQVRGLGLVHPIPVDAVTEAELRRGFQQLTKQSLPQALYTRRSLAWETIGAVPEGTDLVKLFGQGGAGVVGYYVPQTGELRFIGTSAPSPDQLVTLAHELTHAIDDQHFDLDGMEKSVGLCEDDQGLALQSLVEGNATYFMGAWAVRNLSPIALFGVSLKAIEEPQGTVRGLPNFLKDGLFPYAAGLKFVQALIRRGGVGAVNEAFRHPPVSTEQILHPKKYPKDRPRLVDVPDYGPALGNGWKDLDVEEIGEEWLRSLLGLHLTDLSAEIAARGWDGGLYRAWSQGDNVAVVMTTVWDSQAEASEFAVRMRDWLEGDKPAEVLPVRGDLVTVVFASDEVVLSRLEDVIEATS